MQKRKAAVYDMLLLIILLRWEKPIIITGTAYVRSRKLIFYSHNDMKAISNITIILHIMSQRYLNMRQCLSLFMVFAVTTSLIWKGGCVIMT
jgi:hypothetical protein